MGQITLTDFILLPVYLWLVYKAAIYFRDKFYHENHPYRVYFIPGLTVKIIGAIFIGLIYNYYYGGGDTFNFFYHAQVINSTFFDAPDTWFRLITHTADKSNGVDQAAIASMYWYDETSAYTVCCLGALIGMFCFTTYLAINVVLAFITFLGMWLMFITFAGQYPKFIKPVAIAILFMPGPIVWGSGLFKDSFCMFAISCLIYSAYVLLEQRKFKVWLILLAIVSLTLLTAIKAYILAAFIPVLIIKIILAYKKKADLAPQKRLAFYFTLFIVMCCIAAVSKKIAFYFSEAAIADVMETIKRQKDYLLQLSIDTQGSAYDLGDFDPNFGSLLSKFWPAVNVALFRPYLWEAKSVIQLFDALQSAALALLTIYVFFKRNIVKTIRMIIDDPNIVMCLLFTLLFAFFVGVSTYNFGSLSRYKIPCTPFYALFLLLLLYKDEPATKAENEPDTITVTEARATGL
jgi:hypothetical protein